jgi:hypothetical protein
MNWNMLNLLYKMKLVTSANLTTWMYLDYMVKLHHMDENGWYGWNLNIWMEPNNVKQIDKHMYEINNIKTFNYVDDVNHEYHMDELIWWPMDKIVFIAKVGHAYVILTPSIKLGHAWNQLHGWNWMH